MARPGLRLIHGDRLTTAPPAAVVASPDLAGGEPHGLFRLLRTIEPPLAAKACRLHSAAELDRIEAMIPLVCGAAGSASQSYRAHRQFHLALVAPAAQPWDTRILTLLMEGITEHMRGAVHRLGLVPRELLEAAAKYQNLVAAYRTGDPDRAAEETLRYIDANEFFSTVMERKVS